MIEISPYGKIGSVVGGWTDHDPSVEETIRIVHNASLSFLRYLDLVHSEPVDGDRSNSAGFGELAFPHGSLPLIISPAPITSIPEMTGDSSIDIQLEAMDPPVTMKPILVDMSAHLKTARGRGFGGCKGRGVLKLIL